MDFQASHVWVHLRVVILFLVLWGSLEEDRLWVKAQDYCHRRSTLDDGGCQDTGRIPHPDVCKSKIIQNHIKNGLCASRIAPLKSNMIAYFHVRLIFLGRTHGRYLISPWYTSVNQCRRRQSSTLGWEIVGGNGMPLGHTFPETVGWYIIILAFASN